MLLFEDEYDDDQDFYFDEEAEDEESISLRDWAEGWYSEPYCDKSEREQFNEDNPNYDYDEALHDEKLYDIDIISSWREYRDEKCDAEDSETFMSYSDWQDKNSNSEEDSA